jgi:hypothetical protein
MLAGVFVEAMLRQQSGVISRRQARDAGMSEDQIDRRLATGRWVTVCPGVYRPADHELSDEARVRAVGLWAGDRATISGLAAAWWHRLWPDPPSVVEVTARLTSGLRPGAGVRLRRRDLLDAGRMATRGLWVTDLPLTVLEAAVALGDQGARLMDQALQRRVRLGALRLAHRRNLGKRGSAVAGAAPSLRRPIRLGGRAQIDHYSPGRRCHRLPTALPRERL